jgi:quercetin dioxygenase-like cupin family protein
MSRTEFITAGDCEPVGELAPGVLVRVFANADKGAQGLTTGTATIAPGKLIPYHTHPTGEAITVVCGEADVLVEGRRYRLRPIDAIHVPAGIAHAVRNPSRDEAAVLHTAFPTGKPLRDFVEDTFAETEGPEEDGDGPEHLMRYQSAPRYQAGEGTEARDLFAARFGAKGVCGGHARFAPGAEIPCHVHDYDESITIVKGQAICRVAGQQYQLSDLDTACIPRDRPHRFLNLGDSPMEMIWVYAGDEPARRLVDSEACEGESR